MTVQGSFWVSWSWDKIYKQWLGLVCFYCIALVLENLKDPTYLIIVIMLSFYNVNKAYFKLLGGCPSNSRHGTAFANFIVLFTDWIQLKREILKYLISFNVCIARNFRYIMEPHFRFKIWGLNWIFAFWILLT